MRISGRSVLEKYKWFAITAMLLLLPVAGRQCYAGDYYTTGYILNDTLVQKKHSPQKAWMFSAVLPGLGQAYNEKYWKIPIIYAGFGVLFYFANENNKKYQDYKEGYIDYLKYEEGDSTATSFMDLDKINPDAGQTKDQITFYKDQFRRNRDLMIISMAGVYFLNIIDAMVDAHFYDYDVSDDISIRIEPDIKNSPIFAQSFRLKMRIKF